ncbi:MAG: septum formation initiator family protein [Acetanaerobacterium sp.]
MKTNVIKKNKIPLIIKLGIFAVCAFSILTTIRIQLDVSARGRELDTLNNQIVGQTLKNKEILKLVESTDDDGYMERMARGRWGYVYPQERVYVDISGN